MLLSFILCHVLGTLVVALSITPMALVFASNVTVCMDEFDAVKECIATQLDGTEASQCLLCIGSVGQTILDFTTCTSAASHYCEGAFNCICSSCNDIESSYSLCMVNASIEGGCEPSCHPSANLEPTPSPPTQTTSRAFNLPIFVSLALMAVGSLSLAD